MGRSTRRNLIGKTALQEKSAELDLPMERLFLGYVMEQLAVKLSESERGTQLLLKNPDVLSLSGLGKGSSHRLYYMYVKQPHDHFNKSDFAIFLKKTIKWETQTNIVWSWRSSMEGDRLIVELLAVLDDMRMPVELIVDPVDEGSFAHAFGEYSLRLIMENNKTCTLVVYPARELFFDDLREALTKLELIGDMAVYERMYETLAILDFEGRQFQKSLEQLCLEHAIVMDEVRYRQMERYQTYPYMKKKWKSYLSKQRKRTPTWEEVYGRFWSFLMPPWDASLHEMVYLGSWMPELRRYLD